MCLFVYVRMCVFVYVSVCVCVCKSVCVCVCVCKSVLGDNDHLKITIYHVTWLLP